MLWPELDVENLDRSTPSWVAANAAVVDRFHGESSDLAAAYISEYRTAEIGADTEATVKATLDRRLNQATLLLAGPVRVKTLIGAGMAPDVAHRAALTKFSGIVRRQSLAGGRHTIADTTRVDQQAIGWRRVTYGDPCTFCALLASRGPVYSSRARAGSVRSGDGLEFHGHCGCTAELVYGTWTPTKTEQKYIDAYEAAAAEASAAGLSRTRKNVLPLMRANGDFRDGPRRRTA